MILNEKLDVDLNKGTYGFQKTILLDGYFDTLKASEEVVKENNFFQKSGSGKLVATILADEYFRNPILKEYQELRMQGEHAKAKRKLQEYLAENTKARFARM